ncbi:MAG: SprT family zinc-dependent metalloprotease [Eubacteriales bacterium]|nr:SprT family zinc-dependent metalloprotease [Eubacteriales bacterium]MDD3881639.1 SprT family zinc-dependent metalloprotease [Eubacteriales bacterium]MDD4512302.1 SprT family zinc-dependent metalloprotease [Eubacteriales bacterium]
MSGYRLIRTARKTVGIRLTQTGEIEVRAPLRLPKAYIDRIIADKHDWLERAKERAESAREYAEIAFGSKVLYMGIEYTLERLKAKSGGKTLISDSEMYISARDGESADTAYEKALRSAARDYLPKRLTELSRRFGAEEAAVRVSGARTRWGSCSRRSGKPPVISLSLRLMQLPPECIDSVIIHELCHLTVLGHGKNFYALMESLNPDWREDYAKEKKMTRRCMIWQVTK